MARIKGVLKAVALASWRDVKTFQSIAGQNLFLFAAFVALQPESAAFFAAILAAVMVFPLSSDPLEKIPADRWRLWPLNKQETAIIRALSLAFSPIVWITIALLIYSNWRTGVAFVAFAVFSRAILYLVNRWSSRMAQFNLLLWVPAPPGILGAIMRLQWREMLSTLDLYVAFLLASGTELYYLSRQALNPAALRIMSLVTVVAMSTLAQVLLGMDGTGVERYRHMPIRGWQILLGKDLAFLTVLALLVVPLDSVSGLAAGVTALAIGHHRSVMQVVPQTRWRFTSGIGIVQTIALLAVGNSARTLGFIVTGPCLLCWILSLMFYGWKWDNQKAIQSRIK